MKVVAIFIRFELLCEHKFNVRITYFSRLRIEIGEQKNIEGTRIVEVRKINVGKMIQIVRMVMIKESLAAMRRIGQEETRIRSIGGVIRMI